MELGRSHLMAAPLLLIGVSGLPRWTLLVTFDMMG